MAFCSRCGAQFEGAFCSACGAPAGAAGIGEAPPPVAGAGLTTNMASTLCYAQSIFIGLFLIALQIVMSVVLPWSLLFTLSPLVSLASLALWIFMLVKTYQGSKVVLPVVGPLAEQQA
jgi:uncharacterized membrane protein